MKPLFPRLLTLSTPAFAALLLAFCPSPPARAAVLEHLLITNFVDSTSCTACHTNAAAQVMHTTHWTWEHTDANGRKLGKNTVINNYCVALPSNEPRCTSCHVGIGYKDKTFDFSDARKVDCLVCHDTTGTYKKHPTMAGAPWTGPGTNIFSGVAYPPVDVTLVARNVGKSSRATCGACHFYGGGGDAVKHGDLDSSMKNPSRELDVHMGVDGKNFTCAVCHKPASGTHEIPGTYYSKDQPDSRSCESCHTAAPHKNSAQAAQLNGHTDRVGCQTCHIPQFARGRTTKMSWDWSTAGVKTNGQNFVARDANGDPIYDTQKGNFTWSSNVVPAYVWFNGTVDYLTVDDVIDPARRVVMTRLQGSLSDPKARILPAKRFTGRQPYDPLRNVIAVPNLFANDASDTNAYWKMFNWTNALASGMAYVGREFSGQVGFVETEWYWIENHMVAPKEKSLSCGQCHTETGGRLDFAALGYDSNKVAFLQSPRPYLGADHSGRFPDGYKDSTSCTVCHPGKVDEVMASAHYLWRTTNANLAFPGGGSHGMLDRFCGLVGASAMVNYYADLGDYKDSSACGKCHIGQGLPFPDPATGLFSRDQKSNVDCLVCHATGGNYDMNGDGTYDHQDIDATARKLLSDPQTGRRAWFQDRSLRAAESVGRTVSTEACLRCHEHGQAAHDYKRGTPYNPEHDVHAAAGLRCTECHLTADHKMARGSRVTDMHAWERPDVEVECARCHGSRPHPEWPDNKAYAPYNDHAQFISCEACHIPYTSGASRRVWYSTFGVTNGPEAHVPLQNPTNSLFAPYSEYSGRFSQRPTYRWFNGDVSMLAEPMHDASAWDFRIAGKATPGAKIYPFRHIVNGMVMDRRGFGFDPNFSTNFTMAAAMDAMAGPMKMMNFMRPEGLNDRERAALSQFPNLLNFDKEHYVKTGNVKEAVDIGLGRLALLMGGQDAFVTPSAVLASIGSNLWSGDLIGLDLPNNPADPTFDPTADPTRVTGSFISLSHAVKRQGALKCSDCHNRSGVLDYQALGYSPEARVKLETLLENVQFVSARRSADGLRLRFITIPGHRYQIQSTTDIKSGVWTPLGSPVWTVGRITEHVVPNSAIVNSPQQFFRVQQSQ